MANVPVPYDHIISPGKVLIGGSLAFNTGDAIPVATAVKYRIPYTDEDVRRGTEAPAGDFVDVAIVITDDRGAAAAPAEDDGDPAADADPAAADSDPAASTDPAAEPAAGEAETKGRRPRTTATLSTEGAQ